MPVKALVEVRSGLAWDTQQDPEETQTLRQIEQRVAGGVGESWQLREGRNVQQRVAWGSSPNTISVPNSPGVLQAEHVLRSLVKEVAGELRAPFLPFSLFSRCLAPSPPQLSDSAKASTVLERHSSSPSPHS